MLALWHGYLYLLQVCGSVDNSALGLARVSRWNAGGHDEEQKAQIREVQSPYPVEISDWTK